MKLLLFAFSLSVSFFSYGQADLILYHGKIFTSNKNNLWVEAIAIKGERIVGIGNESEVMKLKESLTKLIDLKITLAHNPSDPTPWEMVRDSLSKVVKEIPTGTLIQSIVNPDLLEDNRARRKSLDSIAPHHLVMLNAQTGHGRILNSAALTWLGINEQSTFIGGRLEKGNTGKLTGFLEEYAGYRLSSAMNGKLPISKIIEDIRDYHTYTASLGITTMQNMCTQLSAVQAEQVYSKQHFDCRTRLIAFPVTNKDGLLLKEWDTFFHSMNALNYGSGIKMILDGTPRERLACMRVPYRDRKDQYGRLNFTIEDIKTFMQFALSHKEQIMIHAVGDSAALTIINSMRSLHPDAFWKDKRLRFEHGDMAIIKEDDIQTMKQLGIVFVQNPAHLALTSMTLQRFDSSRTKYYQSMRSLIDNEIPFAIGSDGPVNPFVNLMLATYHPNNPKEKITLQEAVIAYTLGSAYAEFTENDKGSLVKGKLADLAVLSQNIFEVSPERLASTESILTILGGNVVLDKKVIK